MVHVDTVRNQPIDEHIIRWIFNDAVAAQISVEPLQQQGQRILAVGKQLLFTGITVHIHQHLHPNQRIGGMEHPPIPVAEQLRYSPHIKGRQAHISKGIGSHQRFNIIVTGAGQ